MMVTNCMLVDFSALVANRQHTYKTLSHESLKGLASVFKENRTRSSISKGEKPIAWNTRWVVKGITKVCLFEQTFLLHFYRDEHLALQLKKKTNKKNQRKTK